MKWFNLSLTSLICLLCSTDANINTEMYLSHQGISVFSSSIDDFKSMNTKSTEDVHSILYLSSYSENMNSYKSNSIQSFESLKYSHDSNYNSINSYSYYNSLNEHSFNEHSFNTPSFNTPSFNTPSFSEASYSHSSFCFSHSLFLINDDYNSQDDTNDDDINDDDTNDDDTNDDNNIGDDEYDKIENYNTFVKVDLDIIGESKATFDIFKQQIFINGLSIIVSINSKLIWFDSITDIFNQQRYLKSGYRKLLQQGVNTILGIAVNDNQGTNVVTLFKNSVEDGTFISILQSNGMSVSLNINEISLVSSPDLSNDDGYNDQPLSDDNNDNGSDMIDLNKEIIIGISSGAGFVFLIIGIMYINKIRNRIRPFKNNLPFTNVMTGTGPTLSTYVPYFKKHNPSVINIDNNIIT